MRTCVLSSHLQEKKKMKESSTWLRYWGHNNLCITNAGRACRQVSLVTQQLTFLNLHTTRVAMWACWYFMTETLTEWTRERQTDSLVSPRFFRPWAVLLQTLQLHNADKVTLYKCRDSLLISNFKRIQCIKLRPHLAASFESSPATRYDDIPMRCGQP